VIEIKMPRLSDTMEEGAISTWHKKPGDQVAVGDILVEIETDKAVMEYEAYEAGTLAEILVPEGQNADIGAPIALLDDGTGPGDVTAGAAPSAAAAAAAAAQADSPERVAATPAAPAASPVQVTPQAAASPAPADEAAHGTANGNGTARPVASPLVRKLARENNLDLSHVTGSGPGGRIIRADISGLLSGPPAAAAVPTATEAAAATPQDITAATAGTPSAAPAGTPSGAPAGTAAPAADEVRGSRPVQLSQVRRVIARRLSASASEIPHFYVTAVADAQELMDLRATLNAQLTEGGRAKISVNDLLIRACALALRAHPDVNVSYDGDASKVMLVHDRINIGVAVAAESGLIVPVIRDADTKTVTQLGAEAKRLVALAAERKLTPEQTSGGTFSISNLGMYGVEQFTAIINPPEAAILAVGATSREPAVVGDTVQPRYRLRYTLSVDHRVVDGALAAKFLQTLTGLIEHPWMIIA
jgi:pyruvate dehydrogenase E2 component (dihydrolipoamide acetyltransferase)